MESIKKDDQKAPKRKKASFLSRLGHRISRAFTKSKLPTTESKNEEKNASKSCLDDLPVTSKSHDNLKMKEETFKTKRKKFGSFLKCNFSCCRHRKRIPPKNDRCLSEGDLTRDDDKFYSGESSPKPRMGRMHNDSSEDNTLSPTDPHNNSVSANKRNFKNELALKLRNKNPPKPKKDEESDSSKTPDSPSGNCPSISPPRQIFNESRTPYSSSSLSHSSNSLLSGNAVCNYTTSDGESMSRSVIDSTDDIGIVVDLTTPISKTTTASLLDSTAARQKIAASRPRRARPKASDSGKSMSGDKLKESGSFSPVRENRDILEEISEEDCQPVSNSPTIVEEELLISPCSTTEPISKTNFSLESQESTDIFIPEVVINTNDVKNVPLEEKPNPGSLDQCPISNPSSTNDATQPNESGDAIVKCDSEKNSVETVNHGATTPSSEEPVKSQFLLNKLKFEDQTKSARPNIALRPVNARIVSTSDMPNNELSKIVLKRTSWAPSSKTQIESIDELISPSEDQTDNKLKINRYTPMNYSVNSKIGNVPTNDKETKLSSNNSNPPPITAKPNIVNAENRKSRVCDLIKNLEGVSCADSK